MDGYIKRLMYIGDFLSDCFDNYEVQSVVFLGNHTNVVLVDKEHSAVYSCIFITSQGQTSLCQSECIELKNPQKKKRSNAIKRLEE